MKKPWCYLLFKILQKQILWDKVHAKNYFGQIVFSLQWDGSRIQETEFKKSV